MKIVDTILFNGEIDMLLFRLTYYDELIDHYIIVEGDKSFTNLEKILYSNIIKNDKRFEHFLYKIDFLIYPITNNNPWFNETESRNYIKQSKILNNLNDLPQHVKIIDYFNHC